MDEHARRNVTLFEQAMRMFNPFAILEAEREKTSERRNAEPGNASPPAAASPDDLEALRNQIAAVQRQLDEMAKKKG